MMNRQLAHERRIGNAAVAAGILADAFPQIVGFDVAGLTAEQVHYYLGESAAVARDQYLALIGGAR